MEHPGISQIKAVAISCVYWPGIDSDLEGLVKVCSKCACDKKAPAVLMADSNSLMDQSACKICWTYKSSVLTSHQGKLFKVFLYAPSLSTQPVDVISLRDVEYFIDTSVPFVHSNDPDTTLRLVPTKLEALDCRFALIRP